MKRIFWLALAAFLAAILFYASRFWFLTLWGRPGLFGLDTLRPQGGLVGQWLRGTDLFPFELLIWAIGAFLLLTFVQRITEFFKRDDH